jgi:diaminohydroxyphosphoribosylaminopyrimidine deaminase/5-amino-6-(5-phosphoribosylamino)uracil reductase
LAGIAVEAGPLAAEARALNRRFGDYLKDDLPWTISKWAMTLDGKIADVDGGARPISGRAAHAAVHEVRGAVDAVAVGVGTVLRDDPLLTARGAAKTRDAARLVLDTHLRTPSSCRLVATAKEWPTWVAAGESAPVEDERRLTAAGCRVLRVPVHFGRLDLRELFRRLRREGIARILLEGGGTVHAAALEAGIVRQLMVFVAPVVLGGAAAPTAVGGPGFRRIASPLTLEETVRREVGGDLLVEGYVSA